MECCDDGVYIIASKFVIYSSQYVDKYDVDSICNTYDTTYFESGKNYTFEIEVLFMYYEYDYKYTQETNPNSAILVSTAQQSSSITLYANTPPVNGNCTVSPDTGTTLETLFNLSCNGWNDNDNDDYNIFASNSDLKYNFIYNDLLFLKSDYDINPFVETLLGFGNQTIQAVILDPFDLATCVEIHVSVDMNISLSDSLYNNNKTTVRNFTSWLSNTYDKLLNNYNDSNDNNYNGQISLITDIAYQVLTEFTNSYHDQENKYTVDESFDIINVQTDIIVSYIDKVTTKIKQTADASQTIWNNFRLMNT